MEVGFESLIPNDRGDNQTQHHHLQCDGQCLRERASCFEMDLQQSFGLFLIHVKRDLFANVLVSTKHRCHLSFRVWKTNQIKKTPLNNVGPPLPVLSKLITGEINARWIKGCHERLGVHLATSGSVCGVLQVWGVCFSMDVDKGEWSPTGGIHFF